MKKGYIKGRKRFYVLCITAAALILAAILPFPATAGARTAGRLVRVGYYEMKGFQEKDGLGNYTGYNIEYLSRVAALAGWRYEYVDVGEFVDGIEALEKHEIDLLSPCQMTAERLENFDFSAYPFGTEYTALITLSDNDKLSYEDYESFGEMTVSVVENYLLTEHFKDYMEEKGFHAALKSCSSPSKAITALKEGKADAAVANLMMVDEGCKVLGRFAPEPFYYVTWKGNEALLDELNDAMREIKNTYPDLENGLTRSFFPQYEEQYFSAEDMQFIAGLGELNVGYAPGRKPISYTDEETGEFSGITRDIVDRIAESTGLKFHYVELPYGPVTYDYLMEHDIRLVTGVEYNSANLNATGVKISNPYLSTKKVLVSKSDAVFDKAAEMRVALSTGSQTIESVLAAEYPSFQIVDYEKAEDCFRAVKRGEADVLMQNQYVAENILGKPQYENMGVIPVEGLDDNQCFSVVVYRDELGTGREEADMRLIPVLNKAISQISQDEVDTIILKEVMEQRYSYTFLDFCYRYRVALCISFFAVAGAFFTVVYIYHLKQKAYREHKEEEEKLLLQQKRYQLIIDKSEEIIYEISLRGGGCLVSDRMKEKFGWSFPEQIENPSVDSLMEIWKVHPEDKEKLRKSLIDMIDENNSTESLIRMRQADGEYIWCKVARFPLLDNDNILVSIVGKIADVDDEVREKKKLELQSRTDGLTRLLNKKTFMKESQDELKKNTSLRSALIFIDLDYFKEVNDKLGHIMGDKAIKDAAKELQNVFSDSGLVARFGGDEFCIFINDISKNTLKDKLGMAVDKLKETYTDGSSTVEVTASIGAAYGVSEHIGFQALLGCADQAVYEAKENGRNQYILKENREETENYAY